MISSREFRREPPPPGPAGVYIDWGPTLPETHGLTCITLLVRDPDCVFAYWEGGDGIQVRDLTDGSSRLFPVPWAGTWYVGAHPEHEYEVDLLLGSRVAAISNRVRTPRRGPAVEVDEEWNPTAAQEEVIRWLAGCWELVRRGYGGEIHSEVRLHAHGK